MKARLDFDQRSATQPDCATQFLNKDDAVKRLLPYHLYDEPNVNGELLSAGK